MSDRVLVLARIVLVLTAIALLLYAATRILGLGIVPGYTPQRAVMVTAALALLALAAGLHKDGWPLRTFRWYRGQYRAHRAVRRATVTGWFLLWVVVLLVGAAVGFARYAEVSRGKPSFQPYLAHGQWYFSIQRELLEEVIRQNEGPEAYGYAEAGDTYVYQFQDKVHTVADRGAFLFGDRADLAGDASNAGVLRVFVIGASVAGGTGASTEQARWYMHLEQSLSSDLGREVRLIPAAVAGYVSTQERIALDLMVLPLCPDAVVILDGFNDVAMPLMFGTRPGDPYNMGILYKESYSPLFLVKEWLARHSSILGSSMERNLLVTVLENQQRILQDPNVMTNYIESVSSVYIDNISNILDRCEVDRILCSAFLQPARPVTWKHQDMQREMATTDVLVAAAYDRILEIMQNLPSRYQVHDLTTAFDAPGAENWYLDEVHFNDVGHKALAAAMHPIVLDLLQQRIASGLGKERCQRAAR